MGLAEDNGLPVIYQRAFQQTWRKTTLTTHNISEWMLLLMRSESCSHCQHSQQPKEELQATNTLQLRKHAPGRIGGGKKYIFMYKYIYSLC